MRAWWVTGISVTRAPCQLGVDRDEAVHLAVELHALDDVPAVGLERAAVVVQVHAGDDGDEPVGDAAREVALRSAPSWRSLRQPETTS